MRSIISSIIFTCLYISIFPSTAKSEPWLATRFAQNCAACHSPSRRNVMTGARRCTVTCQGCHVNPNGGGIRNEYGVWNQQRWLRSYNSSGALGRDTPAPTKFQKYADMPKVLGGHDTATGTWAQMAKDGPPLVVVGGVDYNPKDYDRSDRQDKINVASENEFMARVTADDPYRLERRNRVTAGGDFRYFYLSGTIKDSAATPTKTKIDFIGPMAFDFGVSVRPTENHVRLVAETRYYNVPTSSQSQLEYSFIGGNTPRSAYVLADDFAYNTYVQYGLYKPMFGQEDPDHTSLKNTLLFANNNIIGGDAYNTILAKEPLAVYKALSVGGSSGIPFYNLSYIMPMDQVSSAYHRDTGFAANVGARFVPGGANFMLSYWDTKGPRESSATPKLDNKMWAVSGGFAAKDVIVTLDFSNITKQFYDGNTIQYGTDMATVATADIKYRFWRENYLVLDYATANSARNLKNGSANEATVGYKGFQWAGVETEVLYSSKTDNLTTPSSKTTTNLLQGQIHLFF